MEFLVVDPADEDHTYLKDICCGSKVESDGGHIDIGGEGIRTSGKVPTIIMAHGYSPDEKKRVNPSNLEKVHKDEWERLEMVAQKVSHANAQGTGSMLPIFLQYCFMSRELATHMSKITQRPVIFAEEDFVTYDINTYGDLMLLTESNQGFFRVDAKKGPEVVKLCQVVGIPITEEMSKAIEQKTKQGFTVPSNESRRAPEGAGASGSQQKYKEANRNKPLEVPAGDFDAHHYDKPSLKNNFVGV